MCVCESDGCVGVGVIAVCVICMGDVCVHAHTPYISK